MVRRFIGKTICTFQDDENWFLVFFGFGTKRNEMHIPTFVCQNMPLPLLASKAFQNLTPIACTT